MALNRRITLVCLLVEGEAFEAVSTGFSSQETLATMEVGLLERTCQSIL